MCSVKEHPSACCCPADRQKKFDPMKPVQTSDGRKVRIICTDKKSKTGYSIVALVSNLGGSEYVATCREDGTSAPSSDVLVNIPERREEYYNFYDKNLPELPSGITMGTFYVHKDANSAKLGCKTQNGLQARIIKCVYEDDELVGVELVE